MSDKARRGLEYRQAGGMYGQSCRTSKEGEGTPAPAENHHITGFNVNQLLATTTGADATATAATVTPASG